VTEAEWFAGTDPQPLLWFLGDRASPRKRRLLACAYCRQVWHLVADDRARCAVELAERLADGEAAEDECARAVSGPRSLGRPGPAGSPGLATHRAEIACELVAYGGRALSVVGFYAGGAYTAGGGPGDDASPLQAAAVRDLFAPFGRAAADRRWRTADAVGVARGIYEDRAFDRLPLLADALTDAGCEDEGVLAHCRSAGPHYRGCWVVDLVLGKV